jgi:hypothetical protein
MWNSDTRQCALFDMSDMVYFIQTWYSVYESWVASYSCYSVAIRPPALCVFRLNWLTPIR